MLRYLRIIQDTAADGPGLRTSVYLAGCSHHCPGCHNPQSWNFMGGIGIEVKDLVKKIEAIGNRKVTITGGDPFDRSPELLDLLESLKQKGFNIWVYTGYVLEELQQGGSIEKLCLDYIDGLVDGPFIQELRDPNLKFRGSSNQKIYLRDSEGVLREDQGKYSS